MLAAQRSGKNKINIRLDQIKDLFDIFKKNEEAQAKKLAEEEKGNFYYLSFLILILQLKLNYS